MSDTERNNNTLKRSAAGRARKGALVAGLFLATLGGGAAAFAADGTSSTKSECKWSKSPQEVRIKVDRRLDRLARYIDLSEAQRQQLDPIISGAIDDYFEHRAEGRELRSEAKALVMSGSLDEAQYEPLRQDAVAWFDEVSSIALGTALEAAAVLTDEQRNEMTAKLSRKYDQR